MQKIIQLIVSSVTTILVDKLLRPLLTDFIEKRKLKKKLKENKKKGEKFKNAKSKISHTNNFSNLP